jgi:hypothetical protein
LVGIAPVVESGELAVESGDGCVDGFWGRSIVESLLVPPDFADSVTDVWFVVEGVEGVFLALRGLSGAVLAPSRKSCFAGLALGKALFFASFDIVLATMAEVGLTEKDSGVADSWVSSS